MMHETKRNEWERWLTFMSDGKHRDVWRGVMCVLRWLAIREAEGIMPPGRVDDLENDMAFSCLLKRLVGGQEPYPVAPPGSFGQPWYELIDSGEAHDLEVSKIPVNDGQHVVINESLWTVVNRFDDGGLEVAYHERGERFRLKRDEDHWYLQRVS